jgi:hypothetical protein
VTFRTRPAQHLESPGLQVAVWSGDKYVFMKYGLQNLVGCPFETEAEGQELIRKVSSGSSGLRVRC